MSKKENIITVLFGLLISIPFVIIQIILSDYIIPQLLEYVHYLGHVYPKIFIYISEYKYLFIILILIINILLMFLYKKIMLKNNKRKK